MIRWQSGLLEPLIAAKAKASYEANVGRPSKSTQKSDTIIEKIDTKKEIATQSHQAATRQRSSASMDD